jgi:hypothetical protein
MIDSETLAKLYEEDDKRRITPRPLHYDGHGMNDDGGQRVLTFAKWPDSEGGGYVHTREARERYARLIAAAPELARDNADLREQVAQLLRALEAMHEAEQLYFKARGKEDIAVALVHRVKADELAEKAILKAKGG